MSERGPVGRWNSVLVALAVLLASPVTATELTFDQDLPVTDLEAVDPAYGDGVIATAAGDSRYRATRGFTPHVDVDYGPAGANPSLWTTGYGDLVNVLFKDNDAFPTLEVMLVADPGWDVELHGFDLAAFDAAFPSFPVIIDAVRVLDGQGRVLFENTDRIISHTTHDHFAFDPPLVAPSVTILLDLTNLLGVASPSGGNVSDGIGIDNIRFSERGPVPFAGGRLATGTVEQPSKIFLADLDGDGDRDLLTASFGDGVLTGFVAWHENEGGGIFGPLQTIGISAAATGVTAADLDGDGDLDVLASWFSASKVTWYENLGGGDFGDPLSNERIISPLAAGAFSVQAADIDGDGDPDALAALQSGSFVIWYENDGTPAGDDEWAPHLISSAPGFMRDAFAADIEPDGDLDVVSAALFGNTFAFYENLGGGDFGDPAINQVVISNTALSGRRIRIGDINRDGLPDIVAASCEDDTIAWYPNLDEDGAGNARPIGSVDCPESVSLADLDADGDLDVLAASSLEGSATFNWFRNVDGSGMFGPALALPGSGVAGMDARAADIDGDGDLDVVAARGGEPGVEGEPGDPGRIEWFENRTIHRAVVYPPATPIGQDWDFGEVAVADVNRDGAPDVLAGSGSDARVGWFENTDGAGGFSPEFRNVSPEADRLEGIVPADLDGDGDIDVVAVEEDLSWLEQEEPGAFGEELTISSIRTFKSAAVADIDGDGDLDVVAGGFDGDDAQIGSLHWFANDGTPEDGGWIAGEIAELLEEVNAVAVADLDGDGDLDVVAGAASDSDGSGEIACFGGTTMSRSVGESLIDRPDRDTFVGNVYISTNTPFGINGRVTTWRFYDDGDPGSVVTPLIFELTNAGTSEYTVRGIGETRVSSGTGVQVFPFAPIDGSSDAVRSDYLYGWKFGTPDNTVQNTGAIKAGFFLDDEPPLYKEWGGVGGGPVVQQNVAIDNAANDFRDLIPGRDYSVQFDVEGTTFEPDLALPTQTGVLTLAIVDMDRDGDRDLVASTSDRIVWYENLLGEEDEEPTAFLRLLAESRLVPRRRFTFRDNCPGCRQPEPDEMRAARAVETDFGELQVIATRAGGGFESVDVRDLDDDGDLDVLATVPDDREVLRYENLDGRGFIWKPHVVPADEPIDAITSADLDRDGDLDALVASEQAGLVAWYENVGGQYGSSAEGRSSEIVYEGELVSLLALRLGLNARPGDTSGRLHTIDLRLDGLEQPLDGTTANDLIANLRVYRDTGSGEFEAGTDVLVAVLETLDPGPQAVLGLPLSDDPSAIVASPATFFVVAEIAIGSAAQDPPGFGVTYLGGAEDLRDSSAGIPLSSGPSGDVQSTFVTIVAPIGVDSTVDLTDLEPADGVCDAGDICTLRAAIQEANARPGDDRIVLAAETYTLSVAGGNENEAATGDLDIFASLGSLTIVGAGPGRTIIDAAGIDRVFDVHNGPVRFEGLTIRGGGSAIDFGGGGLRISPEASVVLENCRVTGNAAGQGGGIFNDGALVVRDSSISDNTAELGGGGISNGGSVTLSRSAIARNRAADHAGISNGGSLTLDTSTISGNTALVDAGGIKNNNMLVVRDSTITGNAADTNGGVSNTDALGAVFTARNSIIAGNSAPTNPDCDGTLDSEGHNLIQDATGCTIVGEVPGDQIGVDPLLGPLQNNGGRTETHTLDPGSPAIDQGNCPGLSTDQRGTARADLPTTANALGGDGCDIGAYEISFAQSLVRIEVPIRWCVVEGSPSFDDVPDQAEVNRVLRERHENASDKIFQPQGNIKFRSGANIAIPDYPILPDPDTTIGRLGDVFVDPEARNFDEFQKLIADCRAEWQALDPSVVGITAVNINQFVDEAGSPLAILGLGGRAEPGDVATQLIAGRVMVIDAIYGTMANPVDDIDRLLGHELGHALSLSHGDGVDNEGDTILDNDDERFAQGARFDGPNLLQYRNGTELTVAQIVQARVHLETTIPDLFLDPTAGSLASVLELDLDRKRILDFALEEVLDFDRKRILDFDRKRILDFDRKRILDFEEEEILDFKFANVLDFGMSFDATDTTLFASVGGLPWPTPIRPQTKYLFYVNLDDDVGSGAIPGSQGFPALDDAEEGIDLIASVDLVSDCDLATMECEDSLNLTIFDWNDDDPDAGFEPVLGPREDLDAIEAVTVGLYQSTGGGEPAREDQSIGVVVEAAIPTAILENALPAGAFELGNPVRFQILSVIPCEQTLPDGTIVDCQCDDCAECPEYPGCTDGGNIPVTVGPNIVPGSVRGTIRFRPPTLPECSVAPAVTEPGGAVTVLAMDFPTDTGMPFHVLAGDEVIFTDPAPVADANGVFRLFPTLPLDAIVGELELTVVLESFATTADCFATVDPRRIDPMIQQIAVPSTPTQVGEELTVTAEFIDNAGDTHVATWDWGDGSTSEGVVIAPGEPGGVGTVTGSHVYTAGGVFTITLTIVDDDGNVTQAVSGFVVIFDPGAGFVTGGGWILTPAGGYPADPGFAGQANFGFNARYRGNAAVPRGNLNLHISGAHFKAKHHDWLLIDGATARFQGRATRDGAGDYGFQITIHDSALTPPGDEDRIRIRIWDRNDGDAVVYDTQMGDPEEAQPTTGLGGGSLVIH